MKRFIAMAVAAVVMASGFVVPVMGGNITPGSSPIQTGANAADRNMGGIQVDFVEYDTRVEIVRLLDMTARVSPTNPNEFIRMAYVINEDFVDFFANITHNGNAITTGRMAVEFINDIHELDRQDRQAGRPELAVRYSDFATAVREYVLSTGIGWYREAVSPTMRYAYWVNNPPNTGPVIFSNLPLGHYLVFAGTQTSVHANLHSTTMTFCIQLKGDTIEVDKEVRNPTAGVGEVRIYDVTSAVPDVTGFDTFIWVLHDQMSPGLTFNDDVRLFINDIAMPSTAFSVDYDRNPATHATHPNWTIIEITLEGARNIFAEALDDNGRFDIGDEIRLEYSATINDDAVVGSDGNPNSVRIQYSNDRFINTNYEHTIINDRSTATVFTFDLELLKVDYYTHKDPAATTMLLEDAIFSLYSTTQPRDGNDQLITVETRVHDGTTLYLVSDTLRSNSDGIVRWMRPDASGNLQEHPITVGAGTYYLFETYAPDGFFVIPAPIRFTVTADVDGNVLQNATVVGAATDFNTEFTFHDDGTSSFAIIRATIINYGLDQRLPDTGGVGTTIFMTIGGVVILGSLAGMLVSNRKKVRKSQ